MDITPTWEGILPILLRLYTDSNEEARYQAFKGLARMAELADEYVAARKRSDTFEPIGDAANRVVVKLRGSRERKE